MADFPQRSKAAYNASMARRLSNDQPKPSEPAPSLKSVTNQVADDSSRGQPKNKHAEPAKPSNKNAYRSNKPSRGRSYQKHAEATKIQQPRGTQKTDTAQQHRPAMKKSTYAEEQAKEDAYVKNWFSEANADYEAAKNKGEFDNYVPAAGHAPDFTKFRQMFDANGKPVNGLGSSRHAPKPPEAEKPEKK